MELNKLRKKDQEFLENLVDFQMEKDKFIEENILQEICRISSFYNCEVLILVGRNGRIETFNLGDKNAVHFKSMKTQNGYNGFRLIHTHPNSSANLSDMDKSALKNNRFDCVCAVSIINGDIKDAQVGFLVGDKIEIDKIENANKINNCKLLEKINDLEKQNKQSTSKLFDNSKSTERAVLVMAEFKGDCATDSLEELSTLAKTANIETVGKLVQKRETPDPAFMIGEGKIEELREIIQLQNANLVIFDNELSARKLNNLTDALGVEIIDRSMLILDIFARRARTNEGKLQVELAQLKYTLPRLSAYSNTSGRFGSGGVGMRGPGETKLEINRRIVEKNIYRKTQELKQLEKHRELNRKSRINRIPVVAIVGYTNSGKSTLLNSITKANVYAKDELFATLDTTTRNLWLGLKQELLLTDTVGFINNLPHEFIEAFKSTLEECKYADLLLHVVDISNPNYKKQMEVTLNVLNNLGCTAPVVTVYNKIDKLANFDELEKEEGAIYISAQNKSGLEELKNRLIRFLEERKY